MGAGQYNAYPMTERQFSGPFPSQAISQPSFIPSYNTRPEMFVSYGEPTPYAMIQGEILNVRLQI